MRRSFFRISALIAAALGALAAVLVASLPSGAASRNASARTAHDANVTVTVRGPRGPRGFPGPRGYRGRRGATGPRGFTGASGAVALPLTINWFQAYGGDPAKLGHAGPVTIPGIGKLSVTCTYTKQQITLVPASSAGTRTEANVTTFQGAGTSGASTFQTYDSYGASTPIVIPLPLNGMLTGTLSVQPTYGAGGTGPDPATFTFSSYYKLNGVNNDNRCEVAGQVLRHP